MTQTTKYAVHYLLILILSVVTLAFHSFANAQNSGLAGTWLLERGVDFDGFVSNPTTDLPKVLQILHDRFFMPSGCAVRLKRQKTPSGDIFQSLLKADITEDEINAFYQKQFKLDIRKVKESLQNDLKDFKCYRGSVNLLQLGNILVLIEAGGNLSFSYKRVTPVEATADVTPYSQLPFQIESYEALCPKGISWSKHKPVGVTKDCLPLYAPRIATPTSTDTIARLVGHHNYEGPAVGGQALTNDYDNPVGSGFRPIYQVLPPKGSIALVHVTDEEGSQSRDAMPGAYLSIRNGKVVNQLNSNCTMGLDYVCREYDSKVHYTLNDKGEFVQHIR